MEASQPLIREIAPEDTYAIRHRILRPGRPLEEVQFSGDHDSSTVHIGAFVNDELAGIATLVKNSQPDFQSKLQYQLRGMAVLPEVQGQRIGQQLLRWGESFLKEEGRAELLWCNARETAVKFYEKNDYKMHGDFFEIPNVCVHVVMYKYL